MSKFTESLKAFGSAAANLAGTAAETVQEIVSEAVSEPHEHDHDEATTPAPVSLIWKPIAQAPTAGRDLAKTSIGGKMRFAHDLTSDRRFAFWVDNDVVTLFCEIPRPPGR